MGQALYRKYRPKRLADIVGQEHVTTTLTNALKNGHISHAYLLTGPRGVGKTSIARILAHEINGLPYEDEAHLDIIEIDAASNRRIDEIRDLRDRVNTAPASAQYKVYIIDEVHMLTREAFNALLKTLEEPPAHVVFILATTEAHKLPDTIVSRTQRYTFRPVEKNAVVKHLRTIADAEKIDIDTDALELIAEYGEGSFRDSISLLDQARATGGKVTLSDIERILGRASQKDIVALANAIEQQNPAAIVQNLQTIRELGLEPAMIAVQLSDLFRGQIIDGTAAQPATLLALLERLLDIPAARNPKRLLELVLLEAVVTNPTAPLVAPTTATAAPVIAKVTEPAELVKPTSKPAQTATAPAKTKEVSAELPETPKHETTPDTPEHATAQPEEETVQHSQPQDTEDIAELWQQALDKVKTQYNTLYGIARMAKATRSGDTVTLSLKFAFHQKRLNEVKNRKVFSDVLEQLTGKPIEIVCVVADKEEQAKPDVSTISNIFGGAELLQ